MGKFEVTITHGAGTITWDQTNSEVLSRVWEWAENKPRTVKLRLLNDIKDPARNLLSSSCSRWSSGTGAMDVGDTVELSLYPTGTGAKTAVFHGTISEISPKGRVIEVTCLDRLAAYQGIGKSIHKTFFGNYLDHVAKPHAIVGDRYGITGVNYANLVMPLVRVEFLCDDQQSGYIGDQRMGISWNVDNAISKWAQPFYATQDALLGVQVFISSDGGTSNTLTVAIQRDNGNNEPDGIDMASAIWSNADVYNFVPINLLLMSGEPLALSPGRKYWVVFTPSGYVGGNSMMKIDDDITPALRYYSAGGWQDEIISGEKLAIRMKFDTANYAEVRSSEYRYEADNGRIILNKLPSSTFSQTQIYANPIRGRITGYYGYSGVTTWDVMYGIIRMGPCSPSVSSSIVRRIDLYRTKGRYFSDCLEELAEVREDSGLWTGSQYAIAHSYRSGTDYIHVSRRKRAEVDASVRTFSYGSDVGEDRDEERRIRSFEPMRTIKGRACRVVVNGTDQDGDPILVVVSDESESGGGYSAKSKIMLEISITDDTLKTPQDCAVAGWAKLDSISRDQWEGELVLSGVFPELMDLNYTSPTFGSGQIITLNDSRYGIVNQKFKVKSVKVDNNTTTVSISNFSPLINNAFEDTSATTLKNEAFLAPTDGQQQMYLRVVYDGVINSSYGLMRLRRQGYGDISNGGAMSPVTVLPGGHNQRILHAVFHSWVGYAGNASPSEMVGFIWVMDAAGNHVEIPVPDYLQFFKRKDMVATVEVVSRIV